MVLCKPLNKPPRLNEDIVYPATFSIHAEPYAMFEQRLGELCASKLTSLI
ncbi:hypothetical protein VIBNISFn118_2350001 [Vibrio nigripulchritudo SFn118]|nr:hypothetical protein VIBNISFn118_2350001 [Vibrio nigripulchritudo SFn118]